MAPPSKRVKVLIPAGTVAFCFKPSFLLKDGECKFKEWILADLVTPGNSTPSRARTSY